MPVVGLRCGACSHEWDALQSFSTVDPDLDRCPSCGATAPERMPMAGTLIPEMTEHNMDPDDLAEALDNKRWLETPEMAEKILEGGLRLNERGPMFLRPQCPEDKRKRYF